MSSLIRWRPFTEVTGLQHEMNDAFDRFFGRGAELEPWPKATSSWFPVTNLSETDDNIVFTAEVPGLEPKDLNITLVGDVLTIQGEKRQEKEEKNENFHRIERSHGTFSRSFRVPSAVVTDKIAADYKNGIVRITLPKSDESKRKEVKIKVS